MFRFLSAALLAVVLLSGCNIINPAEPVPTYVRIDSFAFSNPDPAATAGSSRAIRSVFVSFAGKIIGTFDLPATIPILMDAPGTLELFPGVDNAGTASNQILYPHYLVATDTIRPAPGTTIPVLPRTRYTSFSKFGYRETFEGSNDFTTLYGANFTTTSDKALVIDGVRSGYMQLDSGAIAATVSNTVFGAGGGDAFLEIDYRSTAALSVGFYAVSSQAQKYLTTLFPAPAGNKVYVSLSSELNQAASAAGYRVLLRATAAASGGYVVVDNIKVVSF